ncbi:MAG: beta-lactamase family protein [bacterium]|nr:beta-lactamase family protein [bacterium]
MKKFLTLLLFALLLTSCGDSNTAPNSPPLSDLQLAVEDAYDTASKKAGVSVAIYKAGKPEFTYTAGAGFSEGAPSFAYSITKTIVSALILKQIEDGLYTLDSTVLELLGPIDPADPRLDPANAAYNPADPSIYKYPYFPMFNRLLDLVDYAQTGDLAASSSDIDRINLSATVRQLLSHTTGMKNYADNIAGMIPLTVEGSSWNPYLSLNLLISERESNNDFCYSNTNYILLGMIAEVMSGGTQLNNLLKDNFFTPLTIDAALGGQDDIPSNIVTGFDEPRTLGQDMDGLMDFGFLLDQYGQSIGQDLNFYLGDGRTTWAAGGIMSTANNLAKWGFELYSDNGSAVSAAVRETLKDSAPNNDDYGYGVKHNDFSYDDGSAGSLYGHGGGAPGYLTLMTYEASQDVCVVVMTNVNATYSGGVLAQTLGHWPGDSELGVVDRTALTKALLNAYKAGQ